MPLLLSLLGLVVGVGGTFIAQSTGLLTAPVTITPARDGFLVFIGPATSLEQIQGAFFDTQAEADDFALEIGPRVVGLGVWRLTVRDNQIVQGSAVSFSVPGTITV